LRSILPADAVEVVGVDESGEGLMPAVEVAIPEAVEAVLASIGDSGG